MSNKKDTNRDALQEVKDVNR